VRRAVEAIERAGGIVTPRQIAHDWGVSPQAIDDRIRRGTFPEPIAVVGRTRLYLRDQVEPMRPR
jgi:predicted DNA-binding transcriptional regulator AlpA